MSSSSSSEFTTPKPCVLRRSYTVIPGQSPQEHEEMSARLDAENAAIGLKTALVFGIQDSISTKRPLDEASEAQEPSKKKKRKAAPRKKKLTAVEKTMNGKIFYEIALPDGSVVLTSVLEFA